MKALEMFEWELNAEAASGPRSPVLIAREGSFGEEVERVSCYNNLIVHMKGKPWQAKVACA